MDDVVAATAQGDTSHCPTVELETTMLLSPTESSHVSPTPGTTIEPVQKHSGPPDWATAMQIDAPALSINTLSEWMALDDMDALWMEWPFNLPPLLPVPAEPSVHKQAADLKQSWYTHINDERHPSGTGSPLRRNNQVDDEYRRSLQQRLLVQLGDPALPSAEYLNTCVKFYFAKFSPIFPVVHGPSFQPSKRNTVLLLSVCSVGSLLTGHPLALTHGLHLMERLHTAILNHWTSIIRQGSDEALALVQAALLGQTFCLLSGQPEHFAQFDAFLGTVIAWARQIKAFQAQHSLIGDRSLSTWKEWARTEERIRLALALQVHDAEASAICHHEPIMVSNNAGALASDDRLWEAANRDDWNTALEAQNHIPETPPHTWFASPLSGLVYRTNASSFNQYVLLQNISRIIAETRVQGGLSKPLVDEILDHLGQMYTSIFTQVGNRSLVDGNKLLWHYLHITLHSDTDLLEAAVGRDGTDLDQAKAARIDEWVISLGAERAVLHACLIKDWLESHRPSVEPAVHVSRVVFAAGIVLFCFRKYDNAWNTTRQLPPDEFQKFNVDPSVRIGDIRTHSLTDILCTFSDLLPRMSHWPVSKRLAVVIDQIILAEGA